MNLLLFLKNTFFSITISARICLFVVALFVNIFWLYAAKQTHNPDGKELYIMGVEIKKDLVAAENVIHTGNYYFGKDFMGDDDYTYRLPGFLFVYLPFRCFFSMHDALTAIVLLQVLLSALATLALARIVYTITQKPIFYYLAFLLFLGSAYVQNHNFGLNREALTTYVLIFALYILQMWFVNPKQYLMILFSLLLTWCYLYRAFLVPPAFLIFAIIIYYQWKGNKKLPIKLAILLFLPSVLFFSYWISRNYILTKKFIPLETCAQREKSYQLKVQLIQTWGGEILWWEENAEASWFEKPDTVTNKEVSDALMPKFLFDDTLTVDTLKKARACYQLAEERTLPINVRMKYDKKGSEILQKFIVSQKKKYPFRCYVSSKLHYLFTFLNQPIGLRTRNLIYPLNVLCTFITSFVNYLVFFAGFLASMLLLINKRLFKNLFFGQCIIFFLIIFFVGFFTIELRRIAHLFPFLLINVLVVMHLVFEKHKKLGWAILFFIIPMFTVLSVYSCIDNIVW